MPLRKHKNTITIIIDIVIYGLGIAANVIILGILIILSLLDQDLHLRRELTLDFTNLGLQCLVSGLTCLVLRLQDLKLLFLLLQGPLDILKLFGAITSHLSESALCVSDLASENTRCL